MNHKLRQTIDVYKQLIKKYIRLLIKILRNNYNKTR